MLDSLYEMALGKKGSINEMLNDLISTKIDPAGFWIDYNIEESDLDVTISAGDGSINKKKYLSFMFYAIDAECLVYNRKIQRIESSEVDIMPHHRHVEDRLRNYMGIFEIKNALKALNHYDVDLLLFDGSILGNLIRPFPFENELPNETKEKIKQKYFPKLQKELDKDEESYMQRVENSGNGGKDSGGDALSRQGAGITSSRFSSSMEQEYGDKVEPVIYLENLENLLVISKLMEVKEKIVAISKTSTNNDYFRSEIPDMAVFDKHSKKQGYSKPMYLNLSSKTRKKRPGYLNVFKEMKRDFPVLNEFFKGLTFTIFYARLEDHKNILKFELPYEATEEEIKHILGIIKGSSAEGYPYLLKKAHNDVVIRKVDLERLSNIIGFLEKSGREML